MDIDEILGTTRSANATTKSAIYVWGYNQAGQTGRDGKEHQLRIPKQLPPELFGCPAGFNARWLDIACGREHTAAVASDGSLYTWGSNDFGQLGDGTEERRKFPKKNLVKMMEPSQLEGSGSGGKIRDLIFLVYSGEHLHPTRLFVMYLAVQCMWLRCLMMVCYKLGDIMNSVSLGEVLPVKDCRELK